MTSKYQRPAGSYDGASGLANRTKYRDDANAVPKRAISSSKVDGDFNYLIDALNDLDSAKGSTGSIDERLGVSLNADGTMKASVSAVLDDWVVPAGVGTLSRVDNGTFSVDGGDFSAAFVVNRRVKVVLASGMLVGDVSEVSYVGGVTTVACVDLMDADGGLGVIDAAPEQVAYGPLVPGAQGNVPRRVEALTVAGYALEGDGGDLRILKAGSEVARVGAGGLSGYAAGSVGLAALSVDARVPAGAVVPFAGASAPEGWLLCDGSAVSRNDYSGLFAAIGETFGAGDGSGTFNLPDLRGRAVFSPDGMGGTTAGRLDGGALGDGGGAQTKDGETDGHVLTVAEMPAHSHAIEAVPVVAGNGDGGGWYTDTSNPTVPVTSSVGGDGAHSHAISGFDVMPPYVLLNHIIKV